MALQYGSMLVTVEGLRDVYDMIDTNVTALETKIATVYRACGSIDFASLPAPSATTLGNVYNITDDFTTTSDFTEGADIDCESGTNVAIIMVQTTDPTTGAVTTEYKYDLFSAGGAFKYTATAQPWSNTVKQYVANESLVTYNDSIYLCLVTHQPTDMVKALESGYWKRIDSYQTAVGSYGGYSQVALEDVAAPKTVTIGIKDTPTLSLPPVECLKKGSQQTNVDVTANSYDTNEEALFNHEDYVEFGSGGVSLKTVYDIEMTLPVALGSNGYISESDYIDFDDYKTVEEVFV